MLHQLLASATDLERWADDLESKSVFPELIRRLVLATGAQLTSLSFASAEGTQLGGWDGISTTEKPSAFVPIGTAGWELGTNQDRKGKADDDYEKRTDDPLTIAKQESTFVFCTPRRWGNKDKWAADRRQEQEWHDVRAYDADDLVTWLSEAPAVHIWLSVLLRKHPVGCIDLESFWHDWAGVITPPVPAALLLAGRDTTKEELQGWLLNPSSTFALVADSRSEAVALLAAVIHSLPELERTTILARTVVVTEQAAWQALVSTATPLLLIPLFRSDEAIASAVRQGHQVFKALDRTDFQTKPHEPARIDRLAATQVLRTEGFPAGHLDGLAGVARRSMAAFRRHRLLQPLGATPPRWATAAHAPVLLAAALIGAWNENEWEATADKEAIVDLTGLPYEQVQAELKGLASADQPPVRQVGSTWYIVDKADVWALMAKFLTPALLERFSEVVQRILGTPLPQFDLPPDQQRWAALLGKRSSSSATLRRQVADTLAFLGADEETSPTLGSVRNLLQQANTQETLWLSLALQLPQLAEARPDEFLDGLMKGLQSTSPPVLVLFQEQDGIVHKTAQYPGLLWALELLAWHPAYLGAVARALARLTQLDPGGSYSNRPARSLAALFLPWYPQTNAVAADRLRILDGLRRTYPDVTWPLLVSLLPNNTQHIVQARKPDWRDWMPTSTRTGISHEDYYRASEEIMVRAFQDAGAHPDRWAKLIPDLPDLIPEFLPTVVQQLHALAASEMPDEGREQLVQALRNLIHFQRSLKRKERTLSIEVVNELENVYQLLLPQDYVKRYAWLFGMHPHLLSGERYSRPNGYDEYRKSIRKQRSETLDELLPIVGVAGILALIPHVEAPSYLGELLGDRADIGNEEKDELLARYLASEVGAERQFAHGLAIGYRLTQADPWGWATAKVRHYQNRWAPAQQVAWLDTFHDNPTTWQLAASLGEATEQSYWEQISPYGIQEADTILAFNQLVKYRRPMAALNLARLYKSEALSTDDLTAAFEAVLSGDYQPETQLRMDGSSLAQLTARLADAPDADDSRLIKIEFALLPAQHERRIVAKALYRTLCAQPEFFADLLQMFTSSDDRSVTPSAEGQDSLSAYKLLHGWTTLPGLAVGGTINVDTLITWVRAARSAAEATGRARRGDELIGEMFSASPDGVDGLWPHEAIRDAIEDAASMDLEHGFEVGTLNNRSFTVRKVYEGGGQEREVAATFTQTATAVAPQWPRLARVLRQLAASYQRRAQREDDDANLEHDLER